MRDAQACPDCGARLGLKPDPRDESRDVLACRCGYAELPEDAPFPSLQSAPTYHSTPVGSVQNPYLIHADCERMEYHEVSAPLGSAPTIHTHDGCAGGQGRTPERVARDGWSTAWLVAAYIAGVLTALGVACGSMIRWTP